MDTILPHAGGLMTMTVVTVPASMPVASLAGLLADRGISSVPVVDAEGRILGIVTECDLLRHLASPEDTPTSWLHKLISGRDMQAKHYARTHGLLARDVMTSPVISVDTDATAAHCAALMEQHRIKRLPVLRNGMLVGVVSRADLLRAVCATAAADDPTADAHIAGAINLAMREQQWSSSLYTFASVTDGVATLDGFVRSDDVRQGVNAIVANVPGVRRVSDHMQKSPLVLPGEVF